MKAKATKAMTNRPAPAALSRALALMLASAPVAAQTDDSPEKRLTAWNPAWEEVCLLPGADRPGPEGLAVIEAALSGEDDFAAYLAEVVRAADVVFCVDPRLADCRGYYEPASRVVALDPGLSPEEMLLIAVHELRHADQLRRGFGLSLEWARLENVRLIFALEADAQAISTLYAARAAETEDGRSLWEAAQSLEHYEDLARIFAEARAEGDVAATRATFAGWYASQWRREKYYLAACASYLDQRDALHARASYAQLPPDHFDRLCTMPGGENYGCHLTEEIARRPREWE